MKKNKRFAFTLAEVLITLGIIGVVAALTVPTLLSNYQTRAWDTAADVFEKKLEQSLRVMNTQSKLSGYKTTEAFAKELSQHMSISKICKNEEITSCFPEKVYWGSEETEVDMKTIKIAMHFGLPDWNIELVGINFSNGVTGVLAYNKECKQDPFSNQVSGRECVALLYDVSGYSEPNAYGKDLRALNVSSLDGSCAFKIGGSICATAPQKDIPISKAECEKLQAQGLLKNCPTENDVYAGAVKYCNDIGKKLPSIDDLNKLAQDLYNTKSINNSWQSSLTRDENKKALFGLGIIDTKNDEFILWSDLEDSNDPKNAYYRHFYSYATYWHSHNGRHKYEYQRGFFCVDK